jgi:glycosyltransferase involved in cell wall biosynthesis
MSNRPLVSIVVNNFNYERFLREAIDSALAQTYAPVEVVVVDDGSTDSSRDIIASYGDRLIPVLKANG